MLKQSVRLSLSFLLAMNSLMYVPYANANGGYRRQAIVDARFGTAEKEAFITSARQVSEAINQQIFGQEIAATILEEKLVQYGESFPNRKGEPVHLNLIGLPGIGKTAMLTILKDLGFNIILLNAQNFTDRDSNFAAALGSAMYASQESPTPTILVVDELDKVPEIVQGRPEQTNSVVGTLNAVLSEGSFHSSAHDTTFNMSNVMVVTTMNFSPKEMQVFTQDVLKQDKSFYDFSIEDFLKFDEWIRDQESARYKVLANLFRSNTVSRLAPNTVIMQPLSAAVYRKIVEVSLQKSLQFLSQPIDGNDQRIELGYDQDLVDYLTGITVYAPSGARETVTKVKALVEQLISYGKKTSPPDGGESFVDRPRKIN